MARKSRNLFASAERNTELWSRQLKCARRARKLRAPQNTLWTRCGDNGESKVERRKGKRIENANDGEDNDVRNLARHMTFVTQVHYDAMLRMMKYVDDTSDRGLVLNPTRKWDGNKEHEFSSLAGGAILTMQKIRRRERASSDTGYYWKVHLWCLRAQRKSLFHYRFVRQSRQREYYVLKTCYMICTSSNRWGCGASLGGAQSNVFNPTLRLFSHISRTRLHTMSDDDQTRRHKKHK